MKPLRRRIGPFEALIRQAEPAAPTMVLFHGYGADGADLAPLAGELPLRRPLNAAFPDAPLILRYDGIPSGRAWFPIDVEAIQRAQMTGRALDWSDRVPEGLAAARAAAQDFLKALGVPWTSLILGGFSQGAMLAVDLALRAPEACLGLIVLSGNLICSEEWRALATKRQGLPFFQTHGRHDPILGYPGARKLETLLKEQGLSGDLLSFDGGHTIPPAAVAALARFIDGLPRR